MQYLNLIKEKRKTYLLIKIIMIRDIDYKKFEDKLLVIYPHLSQKQAETMIKQLFDFWENIIENIDKFEK